MTKKTAAALRTARSAHCAANVAWYATYDAAAAADAAYRAAVRDGADKTAIGELEREMEKAEVTWRIADSAAAIASDALAVAAARALRELRDAIKKGD